MVERESASNNLDARQSSGGTQRSASPVEGTVPSTPLETQPSVVTRSSSGYASGNMMSNNGPNPPNRSTSLEDGPNPRSLTPPGGDPTSPTNPGDDSTDFLRRQVSAPDSCKPKTPPGTAGTAAPLGFVIDERQRSHPAPLFNESDRASTAPGLLQPDGSSPAGLLTPGGSVSKERRGSDGGIQRTVSLRGGSTSHNMPMDVVRKTNTSGEQQQRDHKAAVNRGKQEIQKHKKGPKGMTPELKVALRNALRDKADWHPRLHAAVAAITGMETSHCVRSRVYCTSASTMHSLLNVLLHGNNETGQDPVIDERQWEAIEEVTDLNYLTHIVFRCYESAEEGAKDPAAAAASQPQDPEAKKNEDLKRFRVEVLLSPGVQVVSPTTEEDGSPGPPTVEHFPEGGQLNPENVQVAPLLVMTASATLEELETYLTEAMKQCGKEDMDDENQRDSNNDSN